VPQFIAWEREVASIDLPSCLSVIPDPRIDRNKKHDLSEMLFVSCCAVISGVGGWSDFVEFAKSKLDWLRRFVQLDNGTPVDDTFAWGCRGYRRRR